MQEQRGDRLAVVDRVEVLRDDGLQEAGGIGPAHDHEAPRAAVEDDGLGHNSGSSSRAAANAVSNAFALLEHSRSSSAAIESATMPAPACTLAWPSCHTIVRIAIAVSRLPEKSK